MQHMLYAKPLSTFRFLRTWGGSVAVSPFKYCSIANSMSKNANTQNSAMITPESHGYFVPAQLRAVKRQVSDGRNIKFPIKSSSLSRCFQELRSGVWMSLNSSAMTTKVKAPSNPGRAKHQRQLRLSTTIPPIVGAETVEMPSIAPAMLAYIGRFRSGKDWTSKA